MADPNEARYRDLIDSIQDYAIFILDPTGHIVTWSAGAERIKGYAPSEIIGSHFSRFYPREDVDAGKCEMELDEAERVGRFEDEDWRVRKDGSRFWANVVISAIRDPEGKLTGFSKVTRDLTDRKRAEDDRAARIAAEEANHAKDQFLAILGHELRNPLAPILSALELIKLRGDIPRELEVIERQVKQMHHLVDDLLDVSRIASGKLELTMRSLDLRAVIMRAAEISRPLYERKQQELVISVPRPALVRGDEARLVQVFTNLFNNAAKYTQDGGRVEAHVHQPDGFVVVDIRDNGRGIAASLLPRVFEPFVQAEQDIDRSEGGLGLGLALVKSIVDLHDGTVTVASPGLGQGSTFTVRLPERTIATAPSLPIIADPKPATALRVLIVDDNDDARTLLAELLRMKGFEVVEHPDGEAALANLPSVDVALLDLGLPGMDGFELARRLRASSPRALKLIALSGYAQAQDRSRSQEAGFDAHLAKPINVDRLLEQLR
ncbi:MAG: ATP-binding protein [Kofleriaceae bacterium]